MIHVKHLQRRWFFAFADFLSVIASGYAALYVRKNVELPLFEGLLSSGYVLDTSSLFIPSIFLGLCFLLFQYVFGIYDLWATSSIMSWLEREVFPNILLVACAFSYLYVTKTFDFPRSLLITAGFINLVFGVAWRKLYFAGVEFEKSEVVLVGGREHTNKVIDEFNLPPFKNKVIVKAIFSPIVDEENKSDSVEILSISKFTEFMNLNPLCSIIVVPSDLGYENLFSEILGAAHRGTAVYAMPSAYEILLGKLRHVQVNDLPLLELKLEPPSQIFSGVKRVFDITFAALLLCISLVPMLLIALLICSSSKGSPIYRQKRVGKFGKDFNIYKFRTMVSDAESLSGPTFATKNDPRVTRIGSFLRASRLDELPQLINVLCGEMSFVGPRPERPMFVEKFERTIPGYRERTRIRPGLTGLAQVSGSYESRPEIKLKYDLAYLSNQSIILDLQILVRTAKIVLNRVGQ